MKCPVCNNETDKYFFTGKIVWLLGPDKMLRCKWCSPTYNIRVRDKFD